YDDILVGAPLYDAGKTDQGAAFVFLGSATGIASGDTTSAAAVITGNLAGAQFGWRVGAAGDVNGDGHPDVIVGAPQYSAGRQGAAFVFRGSATGIASGTPANAATALVGDADNAQLGLQVAGAGDVNGDGYDDVIVSAAYIGANNTNGYEAGTAFVF